MKKIIGFLLATVICFSFGQAFAEDEVQAKQGNGFSLDAPKFKEMQKEEVEKDKISTLLTVKTDVVNPEKGESFLRFGLIPYVHYKRIGMGIDLTSVPESDFSNTKPFGTYKLGSWYLVGGLATNSAGADYVNAGVWYVDSYGKLNVFVDLRNYWGIGGSTADYNDDFVAVTWSLDDRWKIGAEASYNYWWKSGDDWKMIGPVVSYKINKNVSVFSRVVREWKNEEALAEAFRLGFQFYY